MINWPAIIKLSNDDELIYIHNQHEWESENHLHQIEYHENDQLIDSSGHTFMLIDKAHDLVNPAANESSIKLPAIIDLVKAHASQQGSCCVAKLYAKTIADAYKIVQSLHDE